MHLNHNGTLCIGFYCLPFIYSPKALRYVDYTALYRKQNNPFAQGIEYFKEMYYTVVSLSPETSLISIMVFEATHLKYEKNILL